MVESAVNAMPQLEPLFLAYCAIVIVLYWLLPDQWRRIFLATVSSIFLCYLDPLSFAVLVAFTGLTYFYGRRPESNLLFAICVALVLALFCSIRILQLLNQRGYAPAYFVLIGYGFYALKLIHYSVESRHQNFKPHTFLDFYNYMLFFPTITIGPIHRFEDFQKSERRIRWDDQQVASGLERILYGYAKVIVLANWLVAGKMDSLVAQFQQGTSLSVFGESLVYGFYLYFAFAGYSDIAIGLALLLGYKINENFHYPFLKRNIGEFWQSWHMSLSSWCRQYVFLPVYANWRNLPLALIGTMLAIALWHEFSLRFFLWGIYHGLGLLIWRIYQKQVDARLPTIQMPVLKGAATGLCILTTFLFVIVGFTIPRSESFQKILANFRTLFSAGQLF